MTLTDQPGDDVGLPVLFDLEEVDGGTQLTIRQDRADFTDEQVAATIAGYNAFIDDIERWWTACRLDQGQRSGRVNPLPGGPGAAPGEGWDAPRPTGKEVP